MTNQTNAAFQTLLTSEIDRLGKEIKGVMRSMESCQSGPMTRDDYNWLDGMWPRLQAMEMLLGELQTIQTRNNP